MASNELSTIVFDFGGVVQKLFDDMICEIFADAIGLSYSEFRPHFDRLIPDVQRGVLSEDDFLKEAAVHGSRHPRQPSGDLFIRPFSSTSHLYPEVVELLQDLQREVQLAVLSNTVPSHAKLNRQRGNFRWFGGNEFLSCETGLLKPSPQSFEIVASDLKTPFGSMVLIDDTAETVRVANKLGLPALRHDSESMQVEGLRKALLARGVRPAGILE